MKALGITDDRDTCECCGRTGLKRVVVIEDAHGSMMDYGTTCAARALGIRGTKATKERAVSEQIADNNHAARLSVFADHCRLVRSCYIPTDFQLAKRFRELMTTKGEKAMDAAIAEGVADRMARWPVTA